MSEQETQSWKANTSGNYYLGKHHMIIAEIFLGIIAAVVLACAVFIYRDDEIPFAAKFIMAAFIVLIAIAVLLLVGGYHYYIYSGKLVIRLGFLRIPIKKIALASIISICTDKYMLRSSKTTGYIRLRKSFGYFSDFGGKIVVIRTHSAKYLLASKDPKNLKSQIEKHMDVEKSPDKESS